MSSTIPTAIANLVTILDAATPADVSVHDGLPATAETPSYICIGYDPDSVMAVEFTQAPAAMRGAGNHSRKEEYDILCLLIVTGGDSDVPALRTSAFSLLATVESTLRSNITLTGALGSGGTAQLSAGQLDQGEGENGDAAGLRFRVTCKARI